MWDSICLYMNNSDNKVLNCFLPCLLNWSAIVFLQAGILTDDGW